MGAIRATKRSHSGEAQLHRWTWIVSCFEYAVNGGALLHAYIQNHDSCPDCMLSHFSHTRLFWRCILHVMISSTIIYCSS